jgi:hypothetical protein
MGRDRDNITFVGTDGLIKYFDESEVQVDKNLATLCRYAPAKTIGELTKKTMSKLQGWDFEVDTDNKSDTYNQVKIFGVCEKNYQYLYRDEVGIDGIIERIGELIQCSIYNDVTICHFGNFDALHIIKLILEHDGYEYTKTVKAFKRLAYGVKGVWKKGIGWDIPPIAVTTLKNGDQIGVKKMVGGCVELFYDKANNVLFPLESPRSAFTVDVSKYFQGTLDKVCSQMGLSYYSKISREAHIVDWKKFDDEFTKGETFYGNQKGYAYDVINSNRLDTYAAKDLMKKILDMFYKVFGHHQKTKISPGSFAETVIADTLTKEENESIIIDVQTDEWQKMGVDSRIRDLVFHMTNDAYYGGAIDSLCYGFAELVGGADINASFPAVMNSLYDLKGSTVDYNDTRRKWSEIQPPKKYQYKYVSITIDIPDNVVSPITVKSPNITGSLKIGEQRQNIRGKGFVTTTCMYEDVSFVLSQIPEDKWDTVVEEVKEELTITTTGQPHPIRKVVKRLWDLRIKYLGTPYEYIIKLMTNSIYGKLYQSMKEFNYDKKNEDISFAGHRTGAYFNPILASIVGSFSKIRLMENQVHVEKNGGDVMQQLTDALFWSMDSDRTPESYIPKRYESHLKNYDNLEENGWDEKKILGLMEKPKQYYNATFLSPAVYELQKEKNGDYTVKLSGFNINIDHDMSKPYLRHKLIMTANYPKDYTLRFGDNKGEQYIALEKKEMVTAIDIANNENPETNYKLFGAILNKEIPLIINYATIQPKREENKEEEKEFSYENMIYDYIKTSPFDLNNCMTLVKGQFREYDNRDMEVRKRAISKDKPKGDLKIAGENKADKEKLADELRKQINENLDVLNIPKMFSRNNKAGREEGKKMGVTSWDGRTLAIEYGLDYLRKILMDKGITPRV